MGLEIKHIATTFALGVVLLLVLARCSAESLDGIDLGASQHAEALSGAGRQSVEVELAGVDFGGIATQDVALCVSAIRFYPNETGAQPITVPIELDEFVLSPSGPNRLGSVTALPGNAYYLVELVLSDTCGSASLRFINSARYFAEESEIVLRFRGRAALGFAPSKLRLNVRRFLVALDSVREPEEIRPFLESVEEGF